METGDRHNMAWQRIYAAPDVGAVLRALRDAGVDDGQQFVCRTREDYNVVAFAISKLKELADDDIVAATDLALHRVLPLLDVAAPEEASIEVSRCREHLIEWLDGFPAPQRVPLEERVLDYLAAQLAATIVAGPDRQADTRTGHPESACWTIAAMGRRRDDIVDELWRVVNRFPDAGGDAALSALADLGLARDARMRIRDSAHARIRARRDQAPLPSFFHVLHALADPESIEVIADTWLALDMAQGSAFLQSVALGLLGDIADAADQLTPSLVNSKAADAIIGRAWRAVRGTGDRISPHLQQWVALGSGIAPNFASPRVVADLLSELVAVEGDDERALHARYLLAERLADCVRPRQLGGWAHLTRRNRRAVMARVREDATRSSESHGPFQTMPGMAKEAAWHTALRLASPEALNWAWAAVSNESSPHEKRSLLERLSEFRIGDIPDDILELIRERRDVRADSGAGVQIHLGAISLAGSSASPRAFAALLDCGLRLDGTWLLDANQRLADIAVDLTRAGNRDVQAQLWQRLLSSAPDADRTAAAFALEELSGHELLAMDAASLQELALPLLREDGRSEYQRALVAAMLAQTLLHWDVPLPAEIEALLVEWATTVRDLRGWVALQALAQFNRLASHQELLRDRLGLQLTAKGWDLAPISKEESLRRIYGSQGTRPLAVLAWLYRADPEGFAPAVASSIERPQTPHLGPLLGMLQEMHRSGDATRSLPSRVADALVSTQRQDWPYTSRSEVLGAAARLVPEKLARAALAEQARDWPTDARVAVADALGSADYGTSEARYLAAEQLLALAGDGQYGVRRAAYRGLSRVMPEALAAACVLWQASLDADWRRRGGEASGWLVQNQPVGPGDGDRLYEALRGDPERVVREDVALAMRERRARGWVRDLQGMLLVKRDWTEWDNAIVLHLWRLGEAFVRICDDEALAALRDYLRNAMPRHARAWLTRLYEEGRKAWEDTMKKWPEPWVEKLGKFTVQRGTLTGKYDRHEITVPCVALRFTTNTEMTIHRGVLILDPGDSLSFEATDLGGRLELSDNTHQDIHIATIGPSSRTATFETAPSESSLR